MKDCIVAEELEDEFDYFILDEAIFDIKDIMSDLAYLENMIYKNELQRPTVKLVRKINNRLLNDNISNKFYFSTIEDLMVFFESYKYKKKAYYKLEDSEIMKIYNRMKSYVDSIREFVRDLISNLDDIRY